MSQTKPYQFSVTIGETCARKMRTFQDLAEKLKMDVTDLMPSARRCRVQPVTHLPRNSGIMAGY